MSRQLPDRKPERLSGMALFFEARKAGWEPPEQFSRTHSGVIGVGWDRSARAFLGLLTPEEAAESLGQAPRRGRSRNASKPLSLPTPSQSHCGHARTVMVGGVGTLIDPPQARRVCLDCGEPA